MSIVHCWTNYGEWLQETYGYLSERHVAYLADEDGPRRTCMLPEGHRGPHEWTNDTDITVTFKEKP